MRIEYDPAKRDATLRDRGVDFADADTVFGSPTYTAPDDRKDYREHRNLTVGRLRGRMVILIWTERDGARRIISMRYANDRERARYGHLLAGP